MNSDNQLRNYFNCPKFDNYLPTVLSLDCEIFIPYSKGKLLNNFNYFYFGVFAIYNYLHSNLTKKLKSQFKLVRENYNNLSASNSKSR